MVQSDARELTGGQIEPMQPAVAANPERTLIIQLQGEDLVAV